MSTCLNYVPTYRCACSWVGGDPDTYRGKPTCPACWHHDRKRRRVTEACPKCYGASSHTCKAECLHCDAESCAHAWFPGQPDTSPASYKRHLRAVR